MRARILTLVLILTVIAGVAGYGMAQAQEEDPSGQGPARYPQELTAKGKAFIEAEVRKHLAYPVSAVFSDWFVTTDENVGNYDWFGNVRVKAPNKPLQAWEFSLKDGIFLVGKLAESKPGFSEGPYKTPLNNTAGYIEKYAAFIAIVKTGNYQKIKAALENGASPAARDENGDSILVIAAKRNFGPEIVQLLLDAGADHRDTTRNGETPLDIYKKNKGNKKSIDILAPLPMAG